MKKLSELYGKKASGSGLSSEGRKAYSPWKGSLQPPSFLISSLEVTFNGYEAYVDPYLGPVQRRKFFCDVKTFIDVADRANEEPQRLGTHAFWEDSYLEQLRKTKRFEKFINRTPILRLLKEKAKQRQIIFLDCLILYYKGILQLGDFSYEQFIYDLNDKKDSSSPFDGFKKNRDVLASPRLKAIYAAEVKEERAELQWLIKHLELAKTGEYNFGLIDPNFTINALRGRPPKQVPVSRSPSEYKCYILEYRSRCAGGVVRISRLSWPIFHTTAKKTIMKQISDKLSLEFKLKIHSMDVEQILFYLSAYENQINCYDVANAEKTWGIVFENLLPGIIDFSSREDFPDELGAALQSGIDITRLINWFGSLILVEVLQDLNLLPRELEIWMGGDNIGFRHLLEKPDVLENEDEIIYLERLVDINEGLWHILDTDSRILGFDPKKGRIGGLHYSIDGVDSMISWNSKYHSYRWKQNYQTLDRVMDSVIQQDYYEEGTCIKFYKWILERNLQSREEIYNHDDLWKLAKTEVISSAADLFPGLVEWIKAAFLIKDDLRIGIYVDGSDCVITWF